VRRAARVWQPGDHGDDHFFSGPTVDVIAGPIVGWSWFFVFAVTFGGHCSVSVSQRCALLDHWQGRPNQESANQESADQAFRRCLTLTPAGTSPKLSSGTQPMEASMTTGVSMTKAGMIAHRDERFARGLGEFRDPLPAGGWRLEAGGPGFVAARSFEVSKSNQAPDGLRR